MAQIMKKERIQDTANMIDYSLFVKLLLAMSYEGHLHSSTFTSVQGYNNNSSSSSIEVAVGENPANFSVCSFL